MRDGQHRWRLELTLVDTRRKPNAEQRRRQLCDAAISLLAEEGGHGLSHQKVDRRARVPNGTTSFYYRTRSALLHGAAEQIVHYNIELFTRAFDREASADTLLGMLAEQLMLLREEPHLSRARARLELTMLARQDGTLAEGFERVFDGYRSLTRRLVTTMQPDGLPPDPELVAEQASVLLTYLSGLVFGFANGATEPATREQVEAQIRAVIAGVATERGGREPAQLPPR